jgi:thioredoxin reductase (NADPH)
MAKPILLTVDDDADVVQGIERDLRSHYGVQYRVLASDSPEGALDLANQLKLRSDDVGLLLADQRMPRMHGVQFLQKARELFPEARPRCGPRMPIRMPLLALSMKRASITFC